LACQAPASVGWKVTHGSQRSLAQAAGELFTPVNASWLNQAESLLEAFTERLSSTALQPIIRLLGADSPSPLPLLLAGSAIA